MRTVLVDCHPDLEFFLAPDRRGSPFDVFFELPVGLRDLVQSLGVPHVEVGSATVDGAPAGWDRVLRGGERVSLFPSHPLAAPPSPAAFLLDVHLGRLARNLRLLGVDAEHDPDAGDPALAAESRRSGRTLLTRDRGLLMRSEVARGSYIRSTDPVEQTIEVVGRFRLQGVLAPLTRCLLCNVELEDADPDHPGIPDRVRAGATSFRRCPSCDRVYWEGSHTDRMRALVDEVVRRAR